MRSRAILFMSDEAPLRRLVVRSLATDYDMVAVSTVDDAIRLVRDGWRFEAIVCDLGLPDVTGPAELVAQLERLDPEQVRRIAFVIGARDTPVMDALVDQARYRRIDKPFAVAALRELIDAVVSDAGGALPGRRPVAASLACSTAVG